MDSSVTLRSVNKLLGDSFLIPSYQRGYRWGAEQVEDLLTDIWDFHLSVISHKKHSQFYCLQPLVVIKVIEDMEQVSSTNKWEVIDGQQRLTTIHLILTYLSDIMKISRKEKFLLRYSTRPGSEYFLNHIDDAQMNSNIDYFHICQAYKTIDNWFCTHDSGDYNLRLDFFQTLTGDSPGGDAPNVRVIWYEISSSHFSETKKIFQRLNTGKIRLTNAELVKALLLSDISSSNDEILKLEQEEMAQQWDKIEVSLQENRFWYFINEKEKGSQFQTQTRIDFIIDLVCGKSNQQKSDEKEEYYSFRMLSELKSPEGRSDYWTGRNISKLSDGWMEIKRYYNLLQDWYKNNELYHYIGFLICCNFPIEKLIQLHDQCKSKKEFLKEVKLKIKDQLPDKPFDEWGYGDNRRLRNALLLFNVETIVQQFKHISKQYANKDIYSEIHLFPFDIYKIENWDVEHIDSQKENELRSKSDQETWLSYLLDLPQELKNELGARSYEEIKKAYERRKWDDDKFNSWYTTIVAKQLAGYESNSEDTKDGIGNLALLDAGTNRAYKNALFSTKRSFMIKRESAGTFMPVATKNVFLKYYSKSTTQGNKWTADDITSYEIAIKETLLSGGFITETKTEE